MPLEKSESYSSSSQIVPVFVTDVAVTEGDTSSYVVQLQGPGGAIIANTDFSAIELTYVDEATRNVINGRNVQDVLGAGTGANNVTLSPTALLTWNLQPADNVIVDSTGCTNIEFHRAIFKYTFDIGSGTEVATCEVRIAVKRGFKTQLESLN